MMKGKFRQDLFFRLSCHPIIYLRCASVWMICRLLQYFIDEAAGSMNKAAPAIPDELLILLSVYDFPGNIRELRSLVYNAVAQHRSGAVLSMQNFRDVVSKGQGLCFRT